VIYLSRVPKSLQKKLVWQSQLPPELWSWDRKNYSDGQLYRRAPESTIQAECISALVSLGFVCFTVDAGAKALRGRAYGALRRANLGTGSLNGRAGAAQKGVVDIVGVRRRDGKALFIECKANAWARTGKRGLRIDRPAGRPTEEQLDFLHRMYQAHAIVGVAWSMTDVHRIVGFYELMDEE
jgi:hypothetical protein